MTREECISQLGIIYCLDSNLSKNNLEALQFALRVLERLERENIKALIMIVMAKYAVGINDIKSDFISDLAKAILEALTKEEA
jgi:hypothetical protein